MLTVRLGDELAELYRTDGASLWRAVFAYAGNRDVADDAVAEAFAQCLRRGEAVRSPRAWVWRAAFRIAAGELVERRKSFALDGAVGREIPAGLAELFSVLAQLPPRQRGALVLRYYAGYDTTEIARILGCSVATVRVHLSRGTRTLRRLLEESDA